MPKIGIFGPLRSLIKLVELRSGFKKNSLQGGSYDHSAKACHWCFGAAVSSAVFSPEC
jgi:uncharacterized protein YodC (DUF2158 family)